ncbi:Fe-S cluster assembly protein SufD [Thermanaerothrix daxensis]|uniref:Fe-S cluster assembly protein SufD n=1 Tax=Thermanaerothrix daxensis TaxID=869279 RepID=UPI0006C902C8|nr:Fe-S cluster assembly protein SufD [Thermanaerothrix daxensis]
MTKETPEIVVRGRRREAQALAKAFAFQRAMVRTAGLSPGIQAFRDQAWRLFESLPMPDPKDEAWRRTDISGLQAETFRLPQPDAYLDLAPLDESLLSPLAGEAHAGQVVLLPGGVRTSLNESLQAQGVVFTDLLSAERDHADLLEARLGKIVRPEEGKFAAMAAALAHTGVFLYVPRGVVIEQPLHSLLWGPGVGLAHISHLVIWVEDEASVTYVHEYASPTEEGGQTLHVGLVEVYVGEGANLRFVELQSWGEHVWNFTHERVRVARQGNVDWVFGAMGGHVTKNFAELDLVGEGSTGRMSGFYFTDGDQHLDYDSQQNHLAPHTTSDLLFKGALLDRSRVVWQGMIYVAPGAFKTDGYQANRNLVLSRQARADSIPGLEILADDVRCTHGATVGKIDPEQIFYLRARGIPEVEAKRLIVEGFFDPIMQRIPFEGVRARFQEAIQRKMLNFKA